MQEAFLEQVSVLLLDESVWGHWEGAGWGTGGRTLVCGKMPPHALVLKAAALAEGKQAPEPATPGSQVVGGASLS